MRTEPFDKLRTAPFDKLRTVLVEARRYPSTGAVLSLSKRSGHIRTVQKGDRWS